MKIISIIGKEIRTQLRNIGTLLTFTLMPLILILILGITFGSQMDVSGLEIGDMTIEYIVEGEAAELTDGFLSMMAQDELGASTERIKTEDIDAAKRRLADGKSSCLVVVDETDKSYTLYKNSQHNTEASLVEAVMATYVARYNAVIEIIKINPKALAEIDLEQPAGSYSSLVALGNEKNLNSMDYYGIAMVTLFVMYGILQSFSDVMEERERGTGNRILSTTLQKYEFFLGKMAGQIMVLVIQLGAVVVFSTLVFGVSWGDKPLLPFILILIEMVMATSIGIAMGLVMNAKGAGMTLGHMIIVLTAFFGGAYVQTSELGSMGAIGRFFSPIWWVQSGIVNYIYLGEKTTLIQAAGFCLGITALMFVISVIKLSRTEGLRYA